jgi:hypothetical protein
MDRRDVLCLYRKSQIGMMRYFTATFTTAIVSHKIEKNVKNRLLPLLDTILVQKLVFLKSIKD